MNGCQTGCAQFIQGGEKCAPGKCAMVDVPAGVKAADDTRRLDWLEQAYTDGARYPKAWREFMTRVAEVGFRVAIDGVSVPDGETK